MSEEPKIWYVKSEDRGLELQFHDVISFMGRYVIRRYYVNQLASFATVLKLPDITFTGPEDRKKAPEYYALVRYKPTSNPPFGAIYEVGYAGLRIVAVTKELAETEDAIQILALFDDGLEKGKVWDPSIWCSPDFNLDSK